MYIYIHTYVYRLTHGLELYSVYIKRDKGLFAYIGRVPQARVRYTQTIPYRV